MGAKTIRWGIIAPGTIARRFARDIRRVGNSDLKAVGSRSIQRAGAFASAWKVPTAWGSYEELVNDPNLDAVYVASPHRYHREHTLLALEAGKHVLCEKPLGVCAAEVREMMETAQRKKLCLMEAMWTRFLPVMRKVAHWLQTGAIGTLRRIEADFGFRSDGPPSGRLRDPELAGGALLDVGVYPIAFAQSMVKAPPLSIRAVGQLGETGVDEQTVAVLSYPNDVLAQVSCAIHTNSSQGARLYGSKGRITIPSFWRATSAVLRPDRGLRRKAGGREGFQFEIEAFADCLRRGSLECDLMPLSDSLQVAEIMDAVRGEIGLHYPFLKEK